MIDPVTAMTLGIKSTSTEIPKAVVSSAYEAASGAGSFAELLSTFGAETVGKLNNAENMSIGAMRGEVGLREVADAVMSAEQALQAGIAVRDKIVTAYLEISRMAI